MLLHDAGQYANTHCFFQNRGQSPWLPAKQSYLRAGWMDGWMARTGMRHVPLCQPILQSLSADHNPAGIAIRLMKLNQDLFVSVLRTT